jgi:chromate reductase
VRAAGEPAEVTALKAQDQAPPTRMLLVTPEYNFSIPGVLKNTLDWMSRPPEPPFDGKAVAIMGASPGPVGTARVQYDLRKVLVFMNTFTVNKPEVFISNCATKFNAQGEPDRRSRRQVHRRPAGVAAEPEEARRLKAG